MDFFESPFDVVDDAEKEAEALRNLRGARASMVASWNPAVLGALPAKLAETSTISGEPSGESLDVPQPGEDISSNDGYELRVSVTLGRITLPPEA